VKFIRRINQQDTNSAHAHIHIDMTARRKQKIVIHTIIKRKE